MRIHLAVALLVLTACSPSSKRKPEEQARSSSALAAVDASAGRAAAPAVTSAVDASAQDAEAPSRGDAGPAPAFVGVVRGIVKLAKGATLPLAPPPKMAKGTLPATSSAPCPPVDLADQRTVARAKAGGLSPMHVAITGMSAAPQRDPIVHQLYIDGCRLRPTLLALRRGDTLRITNRSEAPLLPLLPGDKFMRGMLRGETREFVVESKGSTPVACDLGNYCGESTVISLAHTLQAVTDDEGRFVIEGVPLDQQLSLHAWHPLFEVSTVPFKLTAEEREKTLELTVTPTASAQATTKQQAQQAPKARAPAKGAPKP